MMQRNANPLTLLDERRLRVVYEVVACDGVRSAAERLEMDASVVSRHIAQLERQLGVSLFDRVGRQMRPTEAGRMLFSFVRERHIHSHDFLAKLGDLRDLRSGSVAIATGEGFLVDLLRQPVAAFLRQHPEVVLRIEAMTVDAMVQGVASDEFEIAIAHNSQPHPALRAVHTRPLPIELIVRADHPLVRGRTSLSVPDLLEFPLALLKTGFGLQKAVEVVEFIERVRFAPQVVTNSLAGLRAFVLAGLGATFMPALVMQDEIRSGEVLALPIQSEIMSGAEMHLLVRKGRKLSPAASQALVHLTRYLSRVPPHAAEA